MNRLNLRVRLWKEDLCCWAVPEGCSGGGREKGREERKDEWLEEIEGIERYWDEEKTITQWQRSRSSSDGRRNKEEAAERGQEKANREQNKPP